jgi:hypothetical protein
MSYTTRRPAALLLLLIVQAATHAATPYQPPAQLDDGWPAADAAKLGWNVQLFADLDAKISEGAYKKIFGSCG